MTALLWCMSLMLTALLFLAVRLGRTTRLSPVPAQMPPPATPIALQTLRPSPRVAVQTSAALMAIALALDVSGPAQVQTQAPAEDGVFAAQTQDFFFTPEADVQAWGIVELAPDWAFKAISTTDGWLI